MDNRIKSALLLLFAALIMPSQARDAKGDNTASCFARATDIITVDVNLDAYSRYIYSAPSNFIPSRANTFNFSITETAYDSLGNQLATTLYFIRQDLATDHNEWSLFVTINGIEVNIAGGYETGASGITGGELTFDSMGNFINQAPPPYWVGGSRGFITEPLGTPGAGVLEPDADQTQTILLDFNLSSATTTEEEPTQHYAPFQLIAISQNGISLCM